MSNIKIYNTKSRKIEDFKPINESCVTLYHCGPTVYNYAHIGNMRAYVFADTIRRMLEWNGFNVKQVVNITDVGHLVSDADEGEDKISMGAKKEGLDVEEVIKKYSDAFYDDLDLLNINRATYFPRATEHIKEQINLILKLESKGYIYKTSDGIYFDTSKFDRYADFAKIDIKGLSAGERVELGEKRNKTDFALWKFPAENTERLQEWDSPWGRGFPGWHIECSAMSQKYLGETIDIHTGGVDHINIHHTNEIAQSECANEKPFVNYWMHVAFMNVEGQKMSKSLGNTYRVGELQKFGISPLGYRYWLLTSSYHSQINFTFDAVKGAENAYNKLRKEISRLPKDKLEPVESIINMATSFINDDLNTAKIIALIHESLQNKDYYNNLWVTFKEIDKILGLSLTDYKVEKVEIPNEISVLLEERKSARENKNWSESDRLRDEILKLGYIVKDTKEGQEIEKDNA